MKTLFIILALITIIVLCLVLWIDKIGHEKRFCHFCNELFLGKKHKNKTCPFCGRKLQSFYKQNKSEEQTDIPFEDFDDKGGE